ncbi:MAG: hypothetical protein JWO82_4074 [Akkermansiaceae bacterium]|nr:hypothetical protein [Akkermansiaceae bacterium]
MSSAAVCLATEKRTLLHFHGPDAERYLNGQMTQDVRSCVPGQALTSCVTDAKGKVQFFIRIFRSGESPDLWVDAPFAEREELHTRLTRYLIADEVEVEDESENWEMTHLINSEAPPQGAMVLHSARIASDGFDVWNPAGSPAPSATVLTDDAAEDSRIRHRIPAWGKEITTGLLAPEAGLDRSAVSYRKGCYIGQEVLSRMKTAGKLNRRLATLLVSPSMAAGDALGAGILTSVSPLPDPETGLHPALGYLHKSQFELQEIEGAQVLGWA